MNGLLISIIIPVLNRPGSVHRAIASAINQQDMGPDALEVVVVDDGSQPPLALNLVDPRIRLVRLTQNIGAAGARNAGIEASSGEVIAFLDSDDVWLPHKLSSQMKLLRLLQSQEETDRGTLVAICCGFYYPHNTTGRLQARIPRPAHRVGDFASGCWFSPGSTQLVPRSAYDTVGMLDVQLRRLEDLDWYIRFGQHGGRLHVAPNVGAVIAPSNSASSQTIMASTKSLENKFQTSPLSLSREDWRKLQAYIALERGAAYLSEKHLLRALGYILTSFLKRPRLHASLETFWARSDLVPEDIRRLYVEMTHG